ncbi:hypothetical protein CQW23_11872 [Capsicum baccatum]|uniref:Uncharacterized protein n=1 Tax=Capsicum baccatum TaxID=33114 RepID=A0A2G2WQZ4_CAPBA|nr:hypothetical protein CQW23_11872 [Capsicum baccatum]
MMIVGGFPNDSNSIDKNYSCRILMMTAVADSDDDCCRISCRIPMKHPRIDAVKYVTRGKDTFYMLLKRFVIALRHQGNTISFLVLMVLTGKRRTRGSFSTSGAQTSYSFPAKSPLQWLLGSARYTNPQNVKNTKITEQIKNIVQASKGYGELKSPGATNESPLMNPIMTYLCDPTLAHSWKGCLDIKGAPEFAPRMLNNCIQAYPPSKVRRDVCNEDTRLYFLASEIERFEIYTALVEFLCNKDSVMRMLINDVELILITKSLIHMRTTRAI